MWYYINPDEVDGIKQFPIELVLQTLVGYEDHKTFGHLDSLLSDTEFVAGPTQEAGR